MQDLKKEEENLRNTAINPISEKDQIIQQLTNNLDQVKLKPALVMESEETKLEIHQATRTSAEEMCRVQRSVS